MKKKHVSPPPKSPLLDEIAAVLQNNPDATNVEICEAVNQWWARVGNDESQSTATDVARIRSAMGIAETNRKPHQRTLFE